MARQSLQCVVESGSSDLRHRSLKPSTRFDVGSFHVRVAESMPIVALKPSGGGSVSSAFENPLASADGLCAMSSVVATKSPSRSTIDWTCTTYSMFSSSVCAVWDVAVAASVIQSPYSSAVVAL